MTRAFVALGSNLMQPERQVAAALRALGEIPGVALVAASSLYRTAPVGYAEQPDFINAVAEVDSALPPEALLEALLALETRFGRARTFRNAPRVLDLDLLYYEGVEQSGERLTLPHPRMQERAFVMAPLAEIAPALQLPAGRADVLAAKLADQAIARL